MVPRWARLGAASAVAPCGARRRLPASCRPSRSRLAARVGRLSCVLLRPPSRLRVAPRAAGCFYYAVSFGARGLGCLARAINRPPTSMRLAPLYVGGLTKCTVFCIIREVWRPGPCGPVSPELNKTPILYNCPIFPRLVVPRPRCSRTARVARLVPVLVLPAPFVVMLALRSASRRFRASSSTPALGPARHPPSGGRG